jgi:hypothetical protein
MYTARYVAEEAGTHQICVQLSGQHIRGSPFSVEVRAAEASAAHCSLIVPAEFERGIYAFESAQLQLQTRDRFGNALTTGGHDIQLRQLHVTGHARPLMQWESCYVGNGMYVVKIRPMQTRGRGCVSILFDGCLIDTKRNPVYFDILVKRSTICELATLEIYTSEANVRCPYTFSIIVAEDLAKELDAASDVSVSDRSPSAANFKCDVRRSAKVGSQFLPESLEFSFRRLFFLGAHPNICTSNTGPVSV